jgi:putative salt-induced outer membrane protein
MPSHARSHSPHPLCTTYLGNSNRCIRVLNGRYRARIAQCALLFVILAIACTARADTITLDNGDRLTGTIVKSDGKELVLMADKAGSMTDKAGPITVQWSTVRQITSTAPLYVVTSQGTTVAGAVTTEGTDFLVTPSSGAPQRIPLANVTTLRSQSEETAYERSLHPSVLESWQINSSLGFALARGNSHTTNLAIGFNAVRGTMNDKLTAYMDSIYASSGLVVTPGVTAGVTANDIRGGAMYQHDLRGRAFAYGAADFEYNELQFLNLRSIWGAGAGYHVIKRTDTTLDLFAGANYTKETYSTGIRRNLAALTVGDLFRHQIGKNTAINETLDVYPELSHLGQYRFALDISLATKIKTWLGWQSTVSDRYISDPIPFTVSNDFIFSTGFNFTFSH